MRKVFWCCLAAGAAMCGALGAVACVSLNPDSPLGCCALAVGRLARGGAAPAAHPGQPATVVDADDLIPPDPTPAEEPGDQPAPPAPPAPGSRLPQAVAALIPPIVIHDEDDLNTPAAGASGQTSAAAHVDIEHAGKPAYDIESIGRRLDGPDGVEHPAVPPMMPRCADDSDAPQMPHCADDADDGTVGCATYREFDAVAFWMGFFSAPTQLFHDPAAGRCEEDAHYTQQYPGSPYTGRVCTPDQPAREGAKPPPAFPDTDETTDPPTDQAPKEVDPLELFDHPHRLPMPRPTEPRSDTMEMRPTDWKPYSLDPGPF